MASPSPKPPLVLLQTIAPSHRRSSAPNKAAPRLPALPEELISNIAGRLGCDDLCILRLTCRDVETKSFHDFATEHFSEKCFMITTDSLKVLLGIANDQRLHSYLHVVYIIPALFADKVLTCADTRVNCKHEASVRQSEAQLTYIRDQKGLVDGTNWRDGEAKHILTEAFQRLDCMRTLAFVDSWTFVGPSVDCRGRNKALRTTGMQPILIRRRGDFSQDSLESEYFELKSLVWKLMLQALADSGSTSLETFGCHFLSPSSGLSVKLDLPRSKATQRGLREALKGVKKLSLAFQGAKSMILRNKKLDHEANLSVIQAFATSFPSVQDLELKYEDERVSVNPIHQTVLHYVDTSILSSLSIEQLNTNAVNLVISLNAMPVIKNLRLTLVDLTEGSWVTILQVLQKKTTLDHLHLMYLSERGKKAFFLSQPDHPDDWENDDALALGFGTVPGTQGDVVNDDDDLPDLEPAHSSESVQNGFDTAINVFNEVFGDDEVDKTHVAGDVDFKAPGMEDVPERGYYICVKGSEMIAKYLAVFVAEYNVGLDGHHGIDVAAMFPGGMPPAFHPPPGVGGPLNLGPPPPQVMAGIMQSFSTALGLPIPVGLPNLFGTNIGLSAAMAGGTATGPVAQAQPQPSSTAPAPGSLADLVANSSSATTIQSTAVHNSDDVAVPSSTTVMGAPHDDGGDGSWMHEEDEEENGYDGEDKVHSSEGGIGLGGGGPHDGGLGDGADDSDGYDSEVLAVISPSNSSGWA